MKLKKAKKTAIETGKELAAALELPKPQTLRDEIQQLKSKLAELKLASVQANNALHDHAVALQSKVLLVHMDRLDRIAAILKEKPELVDLLAPQHSRSSCTDSNPINAESECGRCALLVVKADDGYQLQGGSITLTIRAEEF